MTNKQIAKALPELNGNQVVMIQRWLAAAYERKAQLRKEVEA